MRIESYVIKLVMILMLGGLLGSAAAASNFMGDRIWDETAGQALVYTWTPQTYSGFYYDLDTGEGSEKMMIKLTKDSRTIEEENLEYFTEPIETEFEYEKWGSYQVIGFMAERFFAGYTENSSFADESLSLISDGQLSKVLIDDDDKRSLYTGSSLVLAGDYSLHILEVDLDGDTVWVRLEKDGEAIEDAFLSSNEDYVYETDFGSTEDVPLISVHLSEIFSGVETNAVFVEGVFQISDSYIEVERGDEFGEMEVSSISRTGISLENEDSISLGEGDMVDIMGKLKIRVADSEDLRFAPEVDMSEPGSYELRGTVYDEGETVYDEVFKTLKWTPFNFEGFYYDIDENVSTESLEIKELNGEKIEDGNLVYTTVPKPVEFERAEWGSYEVIGFLAEKYFAGYPEGAFGNSKQISVLSDSLLSRVLIDEDDKKSLFTGSSLLLEEGYVLEAAQIDVSGEKVLFELYRDGKLLDTEAISQDRDYIYETDVAGVEDVPLIAVHVTGIFRSVEVDAVFVEGIFQVSDDFLEIDTDDSFGKMDVLDVSRTGIVLENDDSITLSKDKAISLMGDVGFKVADSKELRFYPFVEVESAAEGVQLEIELPETLVLGQPVEVRVMARGVAVGGAEVFFEDESLGTTSDSGRISYTPEREGSFTLHARKEGYVSVSQNFDVLKEGRRKLDVEVFPESAFEGDTIKILVADSITGDPVEGAEVFFGRQRLDELTSETGDVSYKLSVPGTYMINASFVGFEKGKASVEVKTRQAEFVFSDLLVAPSPVEEGQPVRISVTVKNTGNAAGDTVVELRVDGNPVESRPVSLGPEESTVLEFEHPEEEAGTYLVEVAGLQESYEVSKKAPFIGGIAGLGLFLGAIFLFKRRRKT